MPAWTNKPCRHGSVYHAGMAPCTHAGMLLLIDKLGLFGTSRKGCHFWCILCTFWWFCYPCTALPGLTCTRVRYTRVHVSRTHFGTFWPNLGDSGSNLAKFGVKFGQIYYILVDFGPSLDPSQMYGTGAKPPLVVFHFWWWGHPLWWWWHPLWWRAKQW